VSLGNETKFACVDGPEFDGHKVNFDELQDRLSTYREFEQRSIACAAGTCHMDKISPTPA
jgi:ferredoxin--NADP+ reductase